MSGSIRLTCPHCQRQGSTSASLKAGLRIRCPGCGMHFIYKPDPETDRKPQTQHATDIVAEEIRQNVNIRGLEIPMPAPAYPAERETSESAPVSTTQVSLIHKLQPDHGLPTPNSKSSLPAEAPSTVSPPPLPGRTTKVCVYCGEEILAVAIKCKHCGEIIDPVLRAAEEAKALVRQSPQIININNDTAVSTNVAILTHKRRSSRLIIIGLFLFLCSFPLLFLFPAAGAVLLLLGILLVLVGIAIQAVRAILSFFS